jgi:hypothetical protein
MPTIEYEATNAAHLRADRAVNQLAAEAGAKARADIEATLDESEYNPEHRADVLHRADVAAEAARVAVEGQHWQRLFDQYLAEEYGARSPQRPPVGTVPEGETYYGTGAGELSPRSERRY